MDAARWQAVGSPWVEGLYAERHLPAPTSHDHADLGEPVRVLDRIEERPNRDVHAARLAKAGRDLDDLRFELRHSLAIVLVQHVLEPFTQHHGFLGLLPFGQCLEACELRGAVVGGL